MLTKLVTISLFLGAPAVLVTVFPIVDYAIYRFVNALAE
jgi:hypothetical protein